MAGLKLSSKRKKRIKRVLYAFLIYYLVGVLVWLFYLVFTYPGGPCFGEECPGVKTMLSILLSSPQFWIIQVPLWPVIIALDAVTRSWNDSPIMLQGKLT